MSGQSERVVCSPATRYMIRAGVIREISESGSVVSDNEERQEGLEQFLDGAEEEEQVQVGAGTEMDASQGRAVGADAEGEVAVAVEGEVVAAPEVEHGLDNFAANGAGEGEDEEEQLVQRFQDLLVRLRKERVNVVERLQLDEIFQCVYASLGCEETRVRSEEFAAHMASCHYGIFSRCLFVGCDGGAEVSFQSLDEFTTHHVTSHENDVYVFTSPGISSVVEVPTRVVGQRYPDLFKIVGVTNYKGNYVHQKILTFVHLFYSDVVNNVALAPFSICVCSRDDRNGFEMTPCIDVTYTVSSLGPLQFQTSPQTLLEGFSSAVVYPSLKAYLEDEERDQRLFVCLDDQDRLCRSVKSGEEFFGFTVSAAFTATRIGSKGQDILNSSSWIWSWKGIFEETGDKIEFFNQLERRGYRYPEKMLRAIASVAYAKKQMVVEARDNDEVLVGILIQEIAEIFEKIQTPPQFEPEPYKVSRNPVRKIPAVERVREKKGKLQKSRGRAIKAISPAIIIVADSEIGCVRIKERLLLWFPQLSVILAHEMRIREVRQAAMNCCHVFVATMSKFQYHLEETGVYVVGSNTRVVLAYHCDRLMSAEGVEDVKEFYFPTLDEEFVASRQILWTSKLLRVQEKAIRGEYWAGMDVGFLSVGAVGVMGMEHIFFEDEVPVDYDDDKRPIFNNIIRRNQRKYSHMVVISKARTGVDDAFIDVCRATDAEVKVKKITKDEQYSPNIQAIVNDFFASHRRAILILTPAILNNIEFPRVGAVLIDGLPPNFVEFYRSMEIATHLFLPIIVRTYDGDGGPEYHAFQRDLEELENN